MTDERTDADGHLEDQDETEGGSAAIAGARPVSHYLSFLVLVCLVPAFLFSAYLLIRTNNVQQEGLQTLFQSNTRSIVQVLDQEVAGMLTTLRVLSSDPTFRLGNLEAFHARARGALVGRDMHVIIVDADLNQRLNTRFEYGAPVPELTDRTTPRRALEDRTPIISDVVFSQAALNWVFYAALPVFKENGPPMLLMISREAATLDAVVAASRLPEGWRVAILDSSRNIVASTDDGVSAGGTLPFAFPENFDRGITEVDINGNSFQIIEEQSPLTRWRVVAWAPKTTISAPVLRSIVLLIVGGVSFGLLAAFSAWFIGRRVARSARRLSENAERLGAGEPVRVDQHTIQEFAIVSAALREAAHNREEADGEIRLLMREVAHRSKNQLTVINAMVGQTAKNAVNVEEFVDSFRRRISGLARSTDLLLANSARGVDFRLLVESQIEPFVPADPARVRLAGPKVRVDAQPAQTIGMAMHELATNAAKYGALADDESRLEITWWRRDGTLSLTWREYVGQLAPTPERKGFGSVVLERMMGGTLEAEITRTMHPNGIEWHFSIPLQHLRTDTDNDPDDIQRQP